MGNRCPVLSEMGSFLESKWRGLLAFIIDLEKVANFLIRVRLANLAFCSRARALL
jgi:hypothetical protein